MRRIFSSLELEWKIVLIAAILFVAFLWPVQRYYMGRIAHSVPTAPASIGVNTPP